MHRQWLRWGAGVAAAATLSAAAAEQKLMSVQVRQAPVRSAPSFVAAVAGQLNYGDRVQVLEERPGWIKVSAGALSGWLHATALTEKRVVLAAGQGEVRSGASSEELALAGKGFNADVEARFRAQNPAADFAAVERMERRAVAPYEMMHFLRAGGVRPPEGGAR